MNIDEENTFRCDRCYEVEHMCNLGGMWLELPYCEECAVDMEHFRLYEANTIGYGEEK